VSLRAPASIRLADEDAERVRRSHEEAIRELQSLPSSRSVIVSNKELADGVATQISHGLGRVPDFFAVSPPRGATSTGRIVESRPSGLDRSKFIVLTATGWGGTITVDLEVK